MLSPVRRQRQIVRNQVNAAFVVAPVLVSVSILVTSISMTVVEAGGGES